MESLLSDWLSRYGVTISKRQFEQFAFFKTQILSWNTKMNLTAITEEPDFTVKHFIDSLTVLPFLPLNANVLDLGTGAGFPGIPIRIMRPDISLTLLDSLRKRVFFLLETITLLGLDRVDCIHARAEEYAAPSRHANSSKILSLFDICTARAVAKLDKLAVYAMPLLKHGGLLLAMKGPNVNEEITESMPAIKKCGGTLIDVASYEIAQGIVHTIVVIKKNTVTPAF